MTAQASEDISIVIPVYNDPDGLRATLQSLVTQSIEDFRIYPIDNNSSDGTAQVIKEFESEFPNLICPCEENEIQSSYAARNTGIRESCGETILFVDSDVEVGEDWAQNMMAGLAAGDVDYLGCNIEVVSRKSYNFWERYDRTLSFPVEEYMESKNFAPTCALAVKRNVFAELGLFDERLVSGGDREFGNRVADSSFEQGYTEGAVAYHPARDSLAAIKSKAVRIGRGREQMRQYHPEVGSYYHPLHPINFAPPSPFRFRRRISNRNERVPALIAMYLLEYLLKICQQYGSLRELRT